MKSLLTIKGLSATFLILAASLGRASAQLPSLNDAPWLGYFIGFENKRYKLGISSVGKTILTPMNDRGTPVGHQLAINIEMGILETLPDGKTVLRQIKPETLESSDPATEDLEKAVIRGKVTGDASFETIIEQDRGVISIGGRVLEPGTLKNPLTFAIRFKMPSAYPYDKVADKNDEKAFQKKIEDDRLDIKWTDGKRTKQTFEKEVDASSKEINGPGIAAAQMEISSYKGKRIILAASENSSLTLWNSKPAPLHTGFTFTWQPDPAKDKEAKSRFTIEVK